MKRQFSAMCTVAMLLAVGSAKLRAQAPTDPQIVQIVQTANQIDIDQARTALNKSTDPHVKEFARQMISDHTSLEKSVADLAKKLKVAPQDSATSKQLKQQAADETRKLNSLSGKAFEREYVSHEVAFHQTVIDAVNKILLPDARNAEVKSALQEAAPLLQGHLQHAQQLQQSLSNGK